ncbi:hypothetical protein [Paenibacillus tepidiphilus]|uniref:hypothetical protein n=1 Tax=Paenibacillus tepidiphilus TaxID=2608683 RepID=UPI0012388B09|nr:hypothetical protein [Paenibacillus tepidiphilus]
MTALKTLTALEYSRFSLARRGNALRIAVPSALFLLLVLAGWLLPSSQTSPRAPFISAILLLWTFAIAVSSLHMLSFPAQLYRDWFLTFPCPRLTLLQAQAASLLKHLRNAALLVLPAAAAVYGLSVMSGRYQPLPAGEFSLMLLAYVVFLVALLPVLVVLGLMIGLMTSRKLWMLLFLLPYQLLWMFPIVLVSVINDNEIALSVLHSPYLSTEAALGYTAVLVLIGWPVCRAMLPHIARSALASPAGASRHSVWPEPGRAAPRNKELLQQSSSSSRLLTLYRFEKSRFSRWERIRTVRITKFVLPFVIAALFFIAAADLQSVLALQQPLFMFPALLGTFYMLVRSSFEQKLLPWWLGFPMDRIKLLGVSVAAVWTIIMRISSVFILSAAAGLGAGWIAERANTESTLLSLQWLAYAFLTYAAVFTFMLCLLQIVYALMKSRLLIVLTFPLSMCAVMQGVLIDKFLFPAESSFGMTPDWLLLLAVAAAVLVLGPSCVALGARYLDLSLFTPNSGKQVKQA